MTSRVLITGFEPFGGAETNPSADVVALLDGKVIADREVTGFVLPVEFGESARRLRQEIRRLKPEMVICLGLAASRSRISFERVAVNLDDARIPDNAGRQPIDVPVVKSGPTAFLTSLPVKAMHAGLVEQGYAAELSSSAGNYVCNHLFYALMHALRRRSGSRGGFVHLPAASPQMTVGDIGDAIELAVRIALTTPVDHATAGGRVD